MKAGEGRVVEHAIIGGGLAGCLLAHALLARGASSVAVLDTPLPGASSRIAAGLVNPVSGPRLAPVPGAEVLLPAMRRTFRALGRSAGREFLRDLPVHRLLRDASEQQQARKRRDEGVLDRWVAAWEDDAVVLRGAQADIPGFLSWTRDMLAGRGLWHEVDVDLHALEMGQETATLGGVTARQWTIATGWRSGSCPWFGWVPGAPVKGQILEVSAERGESSQALVSDGWVVPSWEGVRLWCGATNEREFRDLDPDPRGTGEVTRKAQTALRRPVRSVATHAGVRPVIADRQPVLGTHPLQTRLAIFNGLGSRGTMQGPYWAEHLAAHLREHTPLPGEVSVNRWWRPGTAI